MKPCQLCGGPCDNPEGVHSECLVELLTGGDTIEDMKPKVTPFQKLKFYEKREPALRILAGLGLFLSVVLLYQTVIS
jgi:hypothetical protein